MKKNMFNRAMLMLFVATALFATSCKKDKDEDVDPLSGLNANQAKIYFETNANFGGETSYSSNNHETSTIVGGFGDDITLVVNDVEGLTVRNARLTFELPANASTANGNITGTFDAAAEPTAFLEITAMSSGSSQEYIEIQGGTFTITRLDSEAMVGTFSLTVEPTSGSGNITISNGSFAAKF